MFIVPLIRNHDIDEIHFPPHLKHCQSEIQEWIDDCEFIGGQHYIVVVTELDGLIRFELMRLDQQGVIDIEVQS